MEHVAKLLPHGPMYELKRQYYDCAGVTDPIAMGALTAFVPTSQILFGSDYPYWPISLFGDALPNLAYRTKPFTKSNSRTRSDSSRGLPRR